LARAIRSCSGARTRARADEDDEEDGDKVHPTHDDSDEEEDDVADPRLEYRFIRHQGGVNRIRTMPQVTARRLAATWADTGKVHVWDITSGLNELDGRSSASRGAGNADVLVVAESSREPRLTLASPPPFAPQRRARRRSRRSPSRCSPLPATPPRALPSTGRHPSRAGALLPYCFRTPSLLHR